MIEETTKYLTCKSTILLGDGSDAITAGFRDVFGEPEKLVMCFIHVVENLEPYSKRLKKSDQTNLNRDLRCLQTATDEEMFVTASHLFIQKWEKSRDENVKHYLDYFRERWLQKNSGWFEGFATSFPSTNNGIEATNSVIKRDHTLRERLPVGPFLNNVVTLVKGWSEKRDAGSVNATIFHITPSLTLRQWTEGYQWALSNQKVLCRGNTFYTTSTAMKAPITTDILTEYMRQKGKWESFDNFVKWNYGVWAINIDGSCTCPCFSKFNTCKHYVGMLIRLKKVEVPPKAKCIPLGQKRKRGRPSKAKKALIIQ